MFHKPYLMDVFSRQDWQKYSPVPELKLDDSEGQKTPLSKVHLSFSQPSSGPATIFRNENSNWRELVMKTNEMIDRFMSHAIVYLSLNRNEMHSLQQGDLKKITKLYGADSSNFKPHTPPNIRHIH